MKRTRRHKLIHISVIFLAYSCYSMVHVLSENSADSEKVATAHSPIQASITDKPTDHTKLKSTILPNTPEKTIQNPESKEATKLPLLNKDKEEIEDTNGKHHEKEHDETEGKKLLTENNKEGTSGKSTITSESKETPKIEQVEKTKEENKENNKEENKENNKEENKENNKEENKENNKEENKENNKEKNKENNKEIIKENNKKENKENNKEVIKENNKEVIEENNKEETKENKEANKVNNKEEKKDTNKEEKNENNKEEKNESKKEENKEQKKEENKNGGVKPSDKTELTKNNEKEIEEKPKNESEKEIRLTTVSPRPTMRAPRDNCIPPAIEQFPQPLMGPGARKHGGLIVHLIVAIYTFLGLAIVCDEYFVSSLDRICEELKLSPDVAGATFMAAGSSAPELATVVIGVFFAKDDIGVSGVIGSAVFNIMFVISICALCAGTVCHLNWWPLVRDCFFYAVAILVMLFTIYDKVITWDESLFMLFMYVVYCVALHYNALLQRWVETHVPLPASCIRPLEEETALVSYRTLHEDRSRVPSYSGTPPNMTPGQENFGESYISMEQDFTSPTTVGPQLNQMQGNPPPVPPPPQVHAPTQEYYKPKSDEGKPSPLLKPTEGGYYELISWAVVYPIHYMCTVTIPDCKSEKYRNWYPFTFLVSMIWISFYSYIMVWMITIIGSTLGIPDTVMGLTFVAAGVSVPDALSSIAVIKEGYGDMAVSNAVGSNVFDILICLGLPWFIQTAIIMPGSHVNVISKGLTYSTLSLLSTVVFLVVATHLNGWKLDKRYGIILMIWYVIFIIFASLYELNVFGRLNPDECPSDY